MHSHIQITDYGNGERNLQRIKFGLHRTKFLDIKSSSWLVPYMLSASDCSCGTIEEVWCLGNVRELNTAVFGYWTRPNAGNPWPQSVDAHIYHACWTRREYRPAMCVTIDAWPFANASKVEWILQVSNRAHQPADSPNGLSRPVRRVTWYPKPPATIKGCICTHPGYPRQIASCTDATTATSHRGSTKRST